MFRNYLLIAWRNLVRHRIFSVINVSGLAIGLACCFIITLYIKEELSYDRFHEKADRIYRVTREFISPDGSTSLHLARVAPPVGPLFRNDFSQQIETIGRMVFFGATFRYEDKVFNERDLAFADNEILEIFSFDFIEGNPENALGEANSIVITESTAQKYFGTDKALGKVLRFDEELNLKVTGVIKDLPANSHFDLSILGDFSPVVNYYGGRENLMNDWGGNNFATYFILKPGHSIAEIRDRIPGFLSTHINEEAPTWTNLHFMKLTDIHLFSHLDDELKVNGDIKYVYIFAGIALLILVIACINYMNLTTARSTGRAREVGMRKVMGAVRFNLIYQFLAESIVLVLISVLLGVVLASSALPYIRELTGNEFQFRLTQEVPFVAGVLVFTVAVGIAAGSYPAFYLSAFQPVRVLKNQLQSASRGSVLRKVLVVIQFSISVILIVSTILISQQIRFMQNKDLGLDKEQMLILESNQDLIGNFRTFKTELLRHTGITRVAGSRRIPSGRLLDSGGAEAQVGQDMVTPSVVIKDLPVDYDFLETYELKVVAGRAFNRDFATDDTAAYIINRAALGPIGWPSAQESIDKEFKYRGQRGRIIGVVEDFHFESLHNRIAPMVMYIGEDQLRYFSVKINAAEIREAVDHIEAIYAKFSPSDPIVYNFLDDRFNDLYFDEMTRRKLFTWFSSLAIFLACMGVFGLASFTISQRSKEISIRKILGASVGQIVYLLSNELMTLVLVSLVIAFPIVFYSIGQWLENFAYHIDIGLWPFIGAAVITAAIAWVTISMQTVRAALNNPVDELRNE